MSAVNNGGPAFPLGDHVAYAEGGVLKWMTGRKFENCELYTSPAHGKQVAERLALAMAALELADSVMSYCQGDAWERECTEDDRSKFQEIYDQFFPPAPPQPEHEWYVLRKKNPRLPCPICGKKCGGVDGLWEHSKTVHNYTGSQQAFRREHAAMLAERAK